jgi:hypothetical protein
MGRKPKPPARRVRPPIEKDTYNSRELCARYSCAQVTIRRKEREEGFPHGERYGRELTYSKAAVHAWERIHMPHLHDADEDKQFDEDEASWDRLRRRYLLDTEELAAKGQDDDDDPPKPKRRR